MSKPTTRMRQREVFELTKSLILAEAEANRQRRFCAELRRQIAKLAMK